MPLDLATRVTEIKTILSQLRAREADNAEQQFIQNYKKQVITDRCVQTNETYGKAEAEAWAKVAEHNKNEADYKGYETFLSGMLAAFYVAVRLGAAYSASFKLKLVQVLDASLPVLSSGANYTPGLTPTKVVSSAQLTADRKLDMTAMRESAYRSDGHRLTADDERAFVEAVKLWLEDTSDYMMNANDEITPKDGRPIIPMTPERFVELRDGQNGLASYLQAHFTDQLEANSIAPRP